MTIGLLLVSHVKEIPDGLQQLLNQVAKDVPITTAGGVEGGIGTSFEAIQEAISSNPAAELLAFYDLGSAKMNIEMASEFADKPIHLQHTAFIEGAYTAAALLQADVPLEQVMLQLKPLIIQK